MTISPTKLTTQRSATSVPRAKLQPGCTPEEIYYPTRIVRFNGSLFRVMWCDGMNVKLSAEQGGGIYRPYPAGTYWAFDGWVVPVNHIFLSVI